MHRIYIRYYYYYYFFFGRGGGGYGFVFLRSVFLLSIKMALSNVIALDKIKFLVLTKRKTHQEISNILKERYPDMEGLSTMNVRRFW